ncbi:hypothetical protein HF325_004966 [Metschnikowia pulcherrima]|uniref:Mitochondrial Rho GTPase n=1 Tax=Metschnikowia pulcherrima TaxID=27326 RepID=A0A8H7GRF1_9ASCO|nr:hypothetical protein HF325_004966 [Metschnikowia pulcherrima]
MVLRIVVCGDEAVGKSSLIATLVKDDFVPNIQGKLALVNISKDDYDILADTSPEVDSDTESITVRSVSQYIPDSTIVVDTVSSDQVALHKELKQADVILLLYSDHYTYERVSLFWMPMFRALGVNLPIVEGNLKPAAVKALRRVFFLCDADLDGYLNFKEFSDLHSRCFGRAASRSHYDEILQTVNAIILPEWDSRGESRGILESAFIILNKLYAERGRHETIWGILRAFHYTNTLSLNDKFIYPHLDVNPNASVELSPTGYRFLVDLFLKFDKDNDGGLSEEEMANLFLPTPGVPKLWQETNFPTSIVCNEQGYVSLQGWLAQWNLTTFLDHKTTLEYLAYLGFDEGNSVKAVKVTKPRKHRQKQGKQYRGAVNDRNVFNCFVLGAPKSGKSSLLELFIRGSYSDMYSPTIIPKLCVKDIELPGGKQCYLILEELGELEPAILENQKRLDQCDVICYAYDSSDPDLFQYIVNLREKYSKVSQ